MEFSKQEYWGGEPFPSSGDLPDPGIELASLASSALAGRFFTTSATWEALMYITCHQIIRLHTFEKVLGLSHLNMESE